MAAQRCPGTGEVGELCRRLWQTGALQNQVDLGVEQNSNFTGLLLWKQPGLPRSQACQSQKEMQADLGVLPPYPLWMNPGLALCPSVYMWPHGVEEADHRLSASWLRGLRTAFVTHQPSHLPVPCGRPASRGPPPTGWRLSMPAGRVAEGPEGQTSCISQSPGDDGDEGVASDGQYAVGV